MSYWNYRVLYSRDAKSDTESFEVHEVYYTADGEIEAWTENSVKPFGETLEELQADIEHFLRGTQLPTLAIVDVDGTEKLVEIEKRAD